MCMGLNTSEALGVGIDRDGKWIIDCLRDRVEPSEDSNHRAVGVGGSVMWFGLPRAGGGAVGEIGEEGPVGVPGEGV